MWRMTNNLAYEHQTGLILARIGATVVGMGIREAQVSSFIHCQHGAAILPSLAEGWTILAGVAKCWAYRLKVTFKIRPFTNAVRDENRALYAEYQEHMARPPNGLVGYTGNTATAAVPATTAGPPTGGIGFLSRGLG